MNTPRHPFRLQLGFFLPETVGYFHDFPFEFEHIRFNDEFSLDNFKGTVTANRMPQGLLLVGDFSGETELVCVRCLSAYTHNISWDMTELYVFDRENSEEDNHLLPAHAEIDIEDLVREDALVGTPSNPICKEDCQGLCQLCGANLNLEDCGHNDEVDDDDIPLNSPFAGLKDLR